MMPISARRGARALCTLLCFTCVLFSGSALSSKQANTAAPSAAPPKVDNAEFAAAADEVLKEVSAITGLKELSPLKKTLRSRAEIRAYVLREMDDEKNPAERYGETRSAEAFGLIPKGFDLDHFMVDLLTEQIAGLYDPKAREFYVADWIPLDDQRMVMAHELTHALQDQHFQIEAWAKAARPNDDAELAREAVLEGSAMAAMIDYLLKDSGRTVEDLPPFDPSVFAGDLSGTPKLKEAPPFIKDSLVFPYLAGLTFSAAILRSSKWSGVSAVFANPPLSTQQIMHPSLYRSGRTPVSVTLPPLDSLLGKDWSKIDENVMGEFGWKEILKQFLDEERAAPVAAAWEGDHYALYEQKQTRKLVLATRLRLDSEDHTAAFFREYSAALEKKYPSRTNEAPLENFLSFHSPDGGVFLRCEGRECISLEGADRKIFDGLVQAIGWPAAPTPASPKTPVALTHVPAGLLLASARPQPSDSSHP